MSHAEREMWRINIENAVNEVCGTYGADVARSIFQRYDSTNFDDLSSSYYGEVFGDLELIANDN
jgi:hypothetical protein